MSCPTCGRGKYKGKLVEGETVSRCEDDYHSYFTPVHWLGVIAIVGFLYILFGVW